MASKNDDYDLDELDIDKIFANAWETVKKNQGNKHDKATNPFHEYDNPAYKQGMFINTHCNQAKVHSYTEMQQLLMKLGKQYPSDTMVLSAGKSEGYGNPGNALDIWTLQIPVTGKPEQTAFFVGGHHPEVSGPEIVYQVAEQLLLSYHEGNENVKRLREKTHLVFIPQVDVDLFDNLNEVIGKSVFDYYKKAYGTQLLEMNFYGPHERWKDLGYLTPKQTIAVKEFCDRIIEDYGKPNLAMDFHEVGDGIEFAVIEGDLSSKLIQPFYVYAEIYKAFESINPSNVYDIQKILDKKLASRTSRTFSINMSLKGAHGFTVELPKEEQAYMLEERIKMGLITADRILSRHYLNI